MLNLLILICLFVSGNAVKLFIANTNFNNSKNWKEAQVPCSGNHLVFPKRIPRVFINAMSAPLQVMDIDFPINGEIILGNSLQITAFGNQVDDCDSTVSHFTKVAPDDWYNPLNWCQADDINWICLPKPQIEASLVPSASDFVVFPQHSTFYVGINHSEPRILAKSIFFRGTIYSRSYQFQQKIKKTFTRKFVEFVDLNSSYPPQIELQGNKCKKDYCIVNSNLQRMDAICKYVTCQTPKCGHSVKPKGSCCDLCGHLLTVGLSKESNKTKIGDWLNKYLNSQFQKKIIFDLLAVEIREFQLTISPLITESEQFDKIILEIVENIKSNFQGRTISKADTIQVLINDESTFDQYECHYRAHKSSKTFIASANIFAQSTTVTSGPKSEGVILVKCTSCKTPKAFSRDPQKSKYWISLLVIGVFMLFVIALLLYMNRKSGTSRFQFNFNLPKMPKFQFPRMNFDNFRSNFPRVRLHETFDENSRGHSEFVEAIELPDTGTEVSFDNPIYVAEIDDSKQ